MKNRLFYGDNLPTAPTPCISARRGIELADQGKLLG